MAEEITIVIEWENALDVEDRWTRAALKALEGELLAWRTAGHAKPTLLFLHDDRRVASYVIEDELNATAPELFQVAETRIVPAGGLTYYQLKNRGAALADTELVVFLDSDAAPQAGWLEAIIAPFDDPAIVASGGFTTLGHDDWLSRTMALSWIFDLPSEARRTEARRKIHANNFAVRRAFFIEHPFPDLPAFKKQCGFWLRDIDQGQFKWVRTSKARTIHAPHPGYRFLAWRAWVTGQDRDVQVYYTISRNAVVRLLYAPFFMVKKTGRAWLRIVTKGNEVGLPIWQRPFSMVFVSGFFCVALVGEVTAALTRTYGRVAGSAPGPLKTATD